MITDDQVASLFAKANPVPSLDLLDPIEPVDIGSLENRSERSSVMTELKTIEAGDDAPQRGPWLLVAALAAAVLAIGIAVFMAGREAQPVATPLDLATAFWVAVENGDADTAISYLAPTEAGSVEANIFGRAHTLQGQFDWYEAVGFEWDLDQCVETGDVVECNVAGRNAWSDAIGVDPVPGVYVMLIGESGIADIIEKGDSFSTQWLPNVFDVFATWVESNYPEDVPIMWNDADITQETLDRFEVNTARFVEAHAAE